MRLQSESGVAARLVPVTVDGLILAAPEADWISEGAALIVVAGRRVADEVHAVASANRLGDHSDVGGVFGLRDQSHLAYPKISSSGSNLRESCLLASWCSLIVAQQIWIFEFYFLENRNARLLV
ncbi:hypothetical protein ACFLIM_42605 [Nonomuraea sp. M3C6]|uniref:Uncharacterized protein n=1 Tax=Nonomuraea marmarensis TaxID=3351344 RepID=A0ABW7AR68_9ACTN